MIVADAELPFAVDGGGDVSKGTIRLVRVLKDPRILRQTILWISNGGRHYPPWNGRHINVLGLEEVTSLFHVGLSESVARNPISDRSHPTSVALQLEKPLTVPYIMGIAKIPPGFDRVETIKPGPGGKEVVVHSSSGKKAKVRVDLSFLGSTAG